MLLARTTIIPRPRLEALELPLEQEVAVRARHAGDRADLAGDDVRRQWIAAEDRHLASGAGPSVEEVDGDALTRALEQQVVRVERALAGLVGELDLRPEPRDLDDLVDGQVLAAHAAAALRVGRRGREVVGGGGGDVNGEEESAGEQRGQISGSFAARRFRVVHCSSFAQRAQEIAGTPRVRATRPPGPGLRELVALRGYGAIPSAPCLPRVATPEEDACLVRRRKRHGDGSGVGRQTALCDHGHLRSAR
jgi:hypothetical protein